MLGQRLRTARKAKKINQEEIAQYLGLKRQTYSAYEREVSTPDSLTLKKIADYFGVSTEFFFDDGQEDQSGHSEQEERLLLLARRAEKIPSEHRDRIIKSFEDNIDLYLKAMGLAEEE